MASSFTTQGSLQSDPQLAISKGFVPAKTNAGSFLTLPPDQASTQSAPIQNVASGQGVPQSTVIPGLLQSHTPTAPVKKMVDSTGNEVHFDTSQTGAGTTPPAKAPDDPSFQYRSDNGQLNTNYKNPNPSAPASITLPGTIGNNGTNFQQNLGNVQTASNINNNPEFQQGAQNALTINAAQQNAQLAGFAGQGNNLNQDTTNLLGTPYSNIFRPQSTGNLAGEQGLLNPLLNQAGTFATGEQQAGLQAGQLATQGAEAVAGLTAPQPYGITTTPFAPGTGQFGTLPGGGTGGGNAGITLGNIALAQSIPTFQTAINQIDAPNTGIKDTIKNYLTSNPQLNPTPSTLVNGLAQWVASGQLGDPKYQTLANYLTEFATTLAPILGAGGTVTNYKNQLSQSMVNGLAQGKSIAEVLDNESILAQNKLAQMKSTVGAGGSTNAGSNAGAGAFDY